ncbi:helix-turn-helix domain-containing protein [Halomarina oriensis]|uniref:DNA-binding protein n=1 Tax=Halomarina oriensis TaxID=671145 RepID=A0A6B0GVL1_9EURY|nr:helix-turn-helix domain-containing protein [Halomarina oriensis]MWG35748.1 DNA-binding protein [Halomarina oriensis]
MAVVVVGRVPVAEFALEETLSAVPDVEFNGGRIVQSAEDEVVPVIWGRGGERAAVQAALEDDPSTEEAELLVDLEDEWLYRMRWTDRVHLVLQMLLDSHATLLDAEVASDAEHWSLRLLYPTHDELSKTYDYCTENDVTFDIRKVYEMDEEPAGQYGITEGQFAALEAACEGGYFRVPRETNLDAIGEDLDLSHQAVSERIRRGMDSLVSETLLIGNSRQK